jgi:acyl-CoA thioesterase-1
MDRRHFHAFWLSMAAVVIMAGCSEQPAPVTAEAPLRPVSQANTIVAVGDSLTAGQGVAEDQAYPAQLARRLAADGHDYQVINAGVSAETSSGTLARIDWVIASLAPDIVILETGANDGLRGLDTERLESNLDALVQRLKGNGIEVVLAGMLMLPNLGPEYTQAFAETYPRIAEKHDLVLIPFFLDDVAGRVDLNQPDRMHPTANGYARIVETIYPYVITAIERHQARTPKP